MSPNRAQSSARLLAPIALAAFALAVSIVVLGSGGADDGGTNDGASKKGGNTTEQRTARTDRTRRGVGGPENSSTYTVRAGDTLGRIAEKSGVEVETLQELNPAVDPQALVAGQKLKLRE